jgi:hypothetical protein
METEILEPTNELVVLVEQSGLEKTKGQILLDKFSGYFKEAGEYEQKLNALLLKETPDKADMQVAGVFRKAMKTKRVEVENTRKALKEESLREGQTIDSIAKILKNLIEPLEEKAESIEKFQERKEAAEKEARKQERLEALVPYGVAVQASLIADMDEAMWENYFKGVVSEHEAKIEAERKAEEDRKEAYRKWELGEARKEQLRPLWQFVKNPFAEFGEMDQKEFDGLFAEALASKDEWEKEQARIKAENERLQKEKEAADKKAAELKAESDRILAEQKAKAEAERKKAEEEAHKKLQAERDQREKAEAELKAKQAAEAAEKARIEAERIAAEKAASDLAKAGDKARIAAWIDSTLIKPIGTEGMTDESIAICNDIMAKFASFKTWAKKQIEN